MRPRTFAVLLAALLAAACARVDTYRVGVPETTPRAAMAEMVAAALRAAGVRVVPVPCGALRPCVQMLRTGEIDLLPAFTGDATALAAPIGAPEDGTGPQRALAAFARLDLEVVADLGFEAPYVVAVTPEYAERHGLAAIEDLAKIGDGVTMAVPEGYAARPRDGLAALLRRHGIATAPGGVLTTDGPAGRVAALREGRAQAAVLHDLGQDFAAQGLTPLADTLAFFPRYRAVALAGPSAGGALDSLRQAIGPLAAELEAGDVATILRQVEVRGWSIAEAARRVLAQKGIGTREAPGPDGPATTLGYDPLDALGPAIEVASRTVSGAFPDRPVEPLATFDPFGSLRAGRADLAVVDAGRFFLPEQPERFARLDERAEAVAVLGQRYLVALRRLPLTTTRDPLRGSVGLPPEPTTAARAGTVILAAREREPSLHTGRDELIAALRAGEIDTAVLLVTPEGLAETLAEGGLAVRGLARWIAHYPLVFNEARLPPTTFVGQREAMDTLSVQILLAGPAPQEPYSLRAGGPAGAGLVEGQPLTIAEAEALLRAAPAAELPDPLVPAVWERTPARRGEDVAARRDVADTVANVLVLAFAAWCLVLLIRRDRTPPADGRHA